MAELNKGYLFLMSGGALVKERQNNKRLSKRVIAKAEAVSQRCAEIFQNSDNEAAAWNNIRAYMVDNLGRYEYYVVVDETGLALVHTSHLREGVVFNDSVGIKAANCMEACSQLYHRNTGETLVDGAAPIMVNGKRIANVRVGLKINEGSIFPKVLSAVMVPVIIPALLVGFSGSIGPNFFIWLVVGLVLGFIASWWLRRLMFNAVREIRASALAVSVGDLTRIANPTSRDELGTTAYEMNKIRLGLAKIVQEVADMSAKAAKAGGSQLSATEQVSKAGEELAASMAEVAASANGQYEDMEGAANISQKITKAMDGMTTTSQRTVSFGKDTSQISEKGVQIISQSMKQMENIKNSVIAASTALQELEQKSNQISSISKTINDIADQTNLLALNAAIEAARAGEQGKGFAVVADEVRKLAEDSSQSAQQIMQLIKDTQKMITEVVTAMVDGDQQVQKGTEIIGAAGTVISDMKNNILDTVKLIETNFSLTQQLNREMSELLAKIEHTKDLSQKTSMANQDIANMIEEQSAMSQEIKASAEELFNNASEVETIVGRFKLPS